MEYQAQKYDEIARVVRTRVENYGEGPYIYMEVVIYYGGNVIGELKKFKEKCANEIEKLTTMNVQKITVIAKSIELKK